MNMRTYDPASLVNQLQGEINRLFENQAPSRRDRDSSTVATSQWVPPVDIKEDEHRFYIFADLPGVDPNNIEISMENNILTIKGERQIETKDEQEKYSRSERIKGTFYRRFTLPDTADGEKISARSNHGVLEITIPKKEAAKPRKINIQVNQEGEQKEIH